MPENPSLPTGQPRVDQLIEELGGFSRDAECGKLLREILATAMRLGMEHCDLGDFKLVSTSLKELRQALEMFLPYREKRKAVIFGSARTPESHPCYHMAQSLAGELARRNFMIVTGGGNGIMAAANRGAGPGNSFGLNIKLPFEQRANPYIQNESGRLMNFKYFFTRKLMFIKESDATVLFPGGFGTHDEGFENITLFQTGKSMPRPLILVEPEDGNYWKTWVEYIKIELLKPGYISQDDLSLFQICNSVESAAEYIDNFFYAYHSLRYVKGTTVLRFTKTIPESLIARINNEFKDILRNGEIRATPPLPDEMLKKEYPDLPRLALDFNKRSFGRLAEMIRHINRTLAAHRQTSE